MLVPKVNAEAAEDPCPLFRVRVPGSAPWKRSFRPDIGFIQHQSCHPSKLNDRDDGTLCPLEIGLSFLGLDKLSAEADSKLPYLTLSEARYI